MNFQIAYPISRAGQSKSQAVDHSGKILMPSSTLLKLAQLHIEYPLLFKMSLVVKGSSGNKLVNTHVGVLEFTAEEGRVYLPMWIYEQFGLDPSKDTPLITLTNTTLPLGNFLKIEPQSVDFLDISDPKAVLENALRNYSALTVNDIVSILYNDKIYKFKVLEIKPDAKGAISIIETDLSVDFAPPVGYIEPSSLNTQKKGSIGSFHSAHSIGIDQHKVLQTGRSSISFTGTSGSRLSGKPLNAPSAITGNKAIDFEKELQKQQEDPNNPIAIQLPKNKLWFGYPIKEYKKDDDSQKADQDSFKGIGYSLRASAQS